MTVKAVVRDNIANVRTVKYAHSAAVVVGEVIVGNGMVLVAVNAAAINANNAYVYTGVAEFPKAASLAINEFDRVFYDAANGNITKTAGGNTFCGFCVEKAAGADTVVQVFLMPVDALAISETIFKDVTAATISTAGAGTYSAANLVGRLILRDPNGDNRTDTTATAAQIVAAITHPKAGNAFLVVVRNTADAVETITVAGGSGVTISGTATIAQNNTKIFLARLDNVTAGAEAVTLYSIGTMVH